MSNIVLSKIDKTNIYNIAVERNLDGLVVEKLYQEMLEKAYASKKFKEMIEKINSKKIKK